MHAGTQQAADKSQSSKETRDANTQADGIDSPQPGEILPPAAAAPMHAEFGVEGPAAASPSIWDEWGGPDRGPAAAKRARLRPRGADGGHAALQAASPQLAAALKQLEKTRGAMESGPDLGDLLLDFLRVRRPRNRAVAGS